LDIERINLIKKLIIIAIFSDDEFLEILSLKGGNALDLVYNVAQRASIDLDFSIDSDFSTTDLDVLRTRFERLMNATLSAAGFVVFDVALAARPPEVSADLQPFWGGYHLQFKVIGSHAHSQYKSDIRRLRGGAEIVDPLQHRTFLVDFSRHEFCQPRRAMELDDYRIYVYSPEMLACEKLRAICQQLPEYAPVVRRNRPPASRAKDFFDIHTIVTHFELDITEDSNVDLLRSIFAAKRVPLSLLLKIEDQREFHRAGFGAVQDTVKPGVRLRDFDFYFAFVLRLVGELESGGIE
jgi:hypothetical protein